MTHRRHDQPDAQVRRRGLTRVGPVTAGVAIAGSAVTMTVAIGLAVTRADASNPTNTPGRRTVIGPVGGTQAPESSTPSHREARRAVTHAPPHHRHHTRSSGS